MNDDKPKSQTEVGTGKIPLKRLVLFLRWLLFVPAGIFEIILALLAGVTATLHYVSDVPNLIEPERKLNLLKL